MRNMANKAFEGEFSATFALDLAHKDLRLALEMADELGVPGHDRAAGHEPDAHGTGNGARRI